jgi:serine/threonine-protein kinase
MELLNGLDLRSLVDQHGPVPSERAIHFLRQACHSLAEAHAIGLTHRDIKPANIFTCRRGLDYDFVKILDFGLVKDASESKDGEIEHTMPDIVAGTPAFMAPELIQGDGAVDGRVDIYALGCVAYWLVTGQLVFEAESPIRVMLHHVNDAPTPPSSRTELQVPEAFEREVLACLAKNPAQRPQTANELSQRLSECEALVGSWTPDRAESWWRMHLPGKAHVAAH